MGLVRFKEMCMLSGCTELSTDSTDTRIGVYLISKSMPVPPFCVLLQEILLQAKAENAFASCHVEYVAEIMGS